MNSTLTKEIILQGIRLKTSMLAIESSRDLKEALGADLKEMTSIAVKKTEIRMPNATRVAPASQAILKK